jgi:hypothetical protein
VSDCCEPGPASGECEGGEQQSLARLARRFAKPPQQQRSEQHRRERMAPEGDQRFHATFARRSSVKSADMRPGVAKLYKEVVNAATRAVR